MAGVKISKREALFKVHLFHELSLYGKSLEVTQIQDVRKPGTPDFTVSGHHKTHWWEVKHATPNFTTYELQEIKCCRLAKTGFCRYLIYVDKVTDDMHHRYALVLHPALVHGHDGKLDNIDVSKADCLIDGHDHKEIAGYMRRKLFTDEHND